MCWNYHQLDGKSYIAPSVHPRHGDWHGRVDIQWVDTKSKGTKTVERIFPGVVHRFRRSTSRGSNSPHRGQGS